MIDIDTGTYVNELASLYRPSLALLTDLYQVTMAYGHRKLRRTEDEAVFNLFFRTNPFKSGYTIACGLKYVIDFLEDFKFQQDDLTYLAGLKGNDGKSLLEPAFLLLLFARRQNERHYRDNLNLLRVIFTSVTGRWQRICLCHGIAV